MPKFPISQALRDTVESQITIKTVYFASNGAHYFQVYEHKNAGKSTFYGRIDKVSKIVDGRKVETSYPILHTMIVEKMDRDEILNIKTASLEKEKQKSAKDDNK